MSQVQEVVEVGTRYNPLSRAYFDAREDNGLPRFNERQSAILSEVLETPLSSSTAIVLHGKPAEELTAEKLLEELRAGAIPGTPKGRGKKIKTAKVARVVDSSLPGFPSSLEREYCERWARDYCRALCEKYQSVKLHAKLFGSVFNPGGGSLNWQIAAIPENIAQRAAWIESARLSFDKKIGS